MLNRIRSTLLTTALLAVFAPSAWAAGGDLVVADESTSGTGGLVVVTPGTGAQRLLASGAPFEDPVRVAREASGNYVVVDYSALASGAARGAVFRVNAATGQKTTVSSGGDFRVPFDVAVEANGGLVVADAEAFGPSGGVIRVNPTTGAQTPVSSGGSFKSPVGIVVERDGNLLVADNDANTIFRVNPTTGAQTVVAQSPSFDNPAGIALASNGDILVADSRAVGGDAVFRINRVTGVQTVVTRGGILRDAIGIAAAADGDIFLADISSPPANTAPGRVLAVAPSGAQSLVSGGNLLDDPEGLLVLPNVLPTATLAASRSATRTGRSVSFDAGASRDPDGGVVRYDWDLDGNGSFETPTGATPRASRTYTSDARISVAVRVTDTGADTTVARRPLVVDGTAPRIRRASLSRKAFRTKGRRRGTRFRYRLSEAGVVSFRIERRKTGRRARGKCRPRARRGRRCVRWVRVGSLRQRGKAGANSMSFSGKLRGRRLARGRYRAVLTAADALGNRSTVKRLGFRVLRR